MTQKLTEQQLFNAIDTFGFKLSEVLNRQKPGNPNFNRYRADNYRLLWHPDQNAWKIYRVEVSPSTGKIIGAQMRMPNVGSTTYAYAFSLNGRTGSSISIAEILLRIPAEAQVESKNLTEEYFRNCRDLYAHKADFDVNFSAPVWPFPAEEKAEKTVIEPVKQAEAEKNDRVSFFDYYVTAATTFGRGTPENVLFNMLNDHVVLVESMQCIPIADAHQRKLQLKLSSTSSKSVEFILTTIFNSLLWESQMASVDPGQRKLMQNFRTRMEALFHRSVQNTAQWTKLSEAEKVHLRQFVKIVKVVSGGQVLFEGSKVDAETFVKSIKIVE